MRFTLTTSTAAWNGIRPLPTDIHTVVSEPLRLAELELLATLCGLHGHLSALDLLTGADEQTPKDDDLNALLAAFQAYIGPHRMPLSGYTADGARHGSKPRKMDGDGV